MGEKGAQLSGDFLEESWAVEEPEWRSHQVVLVPLLICMAWGAQTVPLKWAALGPAAAESWETWGAEVCVGPAERHCLSTAGVLMQ